MYRKKNTKSYKKKSMIPEKDINVTTTTTKKTF